MEAICLKRSTNFRTINAANKMYLNKYLVLVYTHIDAKSVHYQKPASV